MIGTFGAQSPGLLTRCLRFAGGRPANDARLASGCWPGSTGWDWLPTGFQRKVSSCLLHPFLLSQASPGATQTTFYRFIRDYDLLAPDDENNKKRLAFSMKYANQLWQADTMFGPYVDTGASAQAANRPS